jgi:NAD(P)-dependent dehydrogenase (short-subunit alcohol dehydrogenase family)
MILITGASGGIGNFLFRRYSDLNEVVYGTFFRKNKIMDSDQKMFRVDVRQPAQVNDLIEKLKPQLADITLINCAAISYNSFTHKSDPEKWREVIEVNLFGVYNIVRALLPLMREQKTGRIINFSSVVGQRPTKGASAYAASKTALWGFVKSLAAENGSLNITANNINLGYAEIGMGVNDVPLSFRETLTDLIPSGKFCTAEDIFETVEFIRRTPYLNGASLDINGGLI